MGKQQPKEYYDKIFESSIVYSADAEKTPWTPIWQIVTNTALLHDPAVIYDFGCGCGHLCQLLYRKGFSGSYIGIDFSSVAIVKSIQRNFGIRRASFVTQDISKLDLAALIKNPATSVVVATEYLEHVKHDLEFIGHLPEGVRVIFSVPSFDDPGHERFFPQVRQVEDRYGGLLSDFSIEVYNQHYIFSGVTCGSGR